MSSEALLVCFGCGFQGKGSDSDSIFNDDEAAFILTQVMPVELDRHMLVVVIGDVLPSQFDHCGAAVDLVQEARAKREVDAVKCFVEGGAEVGIEEICRKGLWLPDKLSGHQCRNRGYTALPVLLRRRPRSVFVVRSVPFSFRCCNYHPHRPRLPQRLLHFLDEILFHQRDHIPTPASPRQFGPQRASEAGCPHQLIQLR